jgi:hypothetical protein
LVRGHTASRRNAATTPWLIRSCVDKVCLLFRKIFLPLCPYDEILPYLDLLHSIICALRSQMRCWSSFALDSSERRIERSAVISTSCNGGLFPRCQL